MFAVVVMGLVACSGETDSGGKRPSTTNSTSGAAGGPVTNVTTSSASGTGGGPNVADAAPIDATNAGGAGGAGEGGGAGSGDAGASGSGGTPSDGGGPTTDASGSGGTPSDGGRPTTDCFGTQRLYPTKTNGREWCLPATADQSDEEWGGGGHANKTAEPGVFHVSGSPRIPVTSPRDKPWWRNVEITVYLRVQGTVSGSDIEPEWQLFARGERHSNGNINSATINDGRLAPPGTVTWPGYPFTGTINGHCVASSYKAYLFPTGRMFFKKEISHTAGYTGSRDEKQVFSGGVPQNTWIGFKAVIRNFKNDTAVHMESWIDKAADGTWTKINSIDDTGGWGVGNPDNCGAAPFSYKNDQLITWAGPYVFLRFDNLSSDFKAMSVREIDPLP